MLFTHNKYIHLDNLAKILYNRLNIIQGENGTKMGDSTGCLSPYPTNNIKLIQADLLQYAMRFAFLCFEKRRM